MHFLSDYSKQGRYSPSVCFNLDKGMSGLRASLGLWPWGIVAGASFWSVSIGSERKNLERIVTPVPDHQAWCRNVWTPMTVRVAPLQSEIASLVFLLWNEKYNKKFEQCPETSPKKLKPCPTAKKGFTERLSQFYTRGLVVNSFFKKQIVHNENMKAWPRWKIEHREATSTYLGRYALDISEVFLFYAQRLSLGGGGRRRANSNKNEREGAGHGWEQEGGTKRVVQCLFIFSLLSLSVGGKVPSRFLWRDFGAPAHTLTLKAFAWIFRCPSLSFHRCGAGK